MFDSKNVSCLSGGYVFFDKSNFLAWLGVLYFCLINILRYMTVTEDEI